MATIIGTSAAQKHTGTASVDLIRPNGGNDTIDGLGGIDTVSFSDTYYSQAGSRVAVDLGSGRGEFLRPSGTGSMVTEIITMKSARQITQRGLQG